MQVFTVLSLSSLVAIFFVTHQSITAQSLRGVRPLWLLAALPLIVLDWYGGGFRLYLFSRVFHPSIRFKTCVKGNLANYFMGAVTPAQSGGGPAQVYMMYLGGMPAVEATSASLMAFFSTTFFLILCAAGLYLLRGVVALPGALGGLYHAGIWFFLAIALVMFVAVLIPGFYRELARLIVLLSSKLRGKDYLRAGSRAHDMLDAVDRCHRQLIHYVQRHFHVFVYGVIVSGLCFASKFAVAWVIVRSLGVDASFLRVSLIQMVVLLISYFFPTPGGSGSAELSSAALMSAVVSTGLVGFYVIAWRILTTYVSVAVGACVVLHELGKKETMEVDNTLAEDVPEPEVQGRAPSGGALGEGATNRERVS